MEGDNVSFDATFDEDWGKTKASNVTGGTGGCAEGGGGYGGAMSSDGGGFGGGGKGDDACFNCRRSGHISRECPTVQKEVQKNRDRRRKQQQNRYMDSFGRWFDDFIDGEMATLDAAEAADAAKAASKHSRKKRR